MAGAVPVTFTLRAHELPAAIEPPVSEICDVPATAIAVPPQELFKLGVPAIVRPEGNVSLNATPV